MERRQSQGEEIANSLSHGVGFLAAVVAAPVLVAMTAKTGTRSMSSARASSP
jgi:hemolysin III